jgi:hypothetical protein
MCADTAVALVEAEGFTIEGIDDAARSAGMDAETARALLSFLIEPIIWNGGHLLANDRHRACAMKLAGVRRCPHVGH